MDTHAYSIRVEPFANGTRLWSLEHSARLLATEVYEVENVGNGHRRMIERPDKLIIAITEAIIAAQGGWKRSDGEGPVTAMVDTTDSVEALAKVAT
jgi:hypothetical protein